MANIRLTIQSGNTIYEPPIEEGVQIEWERSGTPGKLTFTTIKVEGLVFNEGDQVCFYYDGKLTFVGYVFSKSRDKEHRIKVTCYDQIRYLKNKYTYVFEKKTATQIVEALCQDFNLVTGEMDSTSYVIPAIAEENKAALDIILNVLEETLLNTGNMFVLQDEAGKIRVRNVANMQSTTLICEDTAENFDYKSSIDDETYNNVVLYYKGENEESKIFTASSPSKIKTWGLLRYFEELKTPTIGQNKAVSLLKLYNKRTRELKVSGAFGDMSIRGGTLIPVKLYLGDTQANNFMLVEKVTHKFDKDHHTMDLTLEGGWNDETNDIVTETIGYGSSTSSPADKGSDDYILDYGTDSEGNSHILNVQIIGANKKYAGKIRLYRTLNGKTEAIMSNGTIRTSADHDSNAYLTIFPNDSANNYVIEGMVGSWVKGNNTYQIKVTQDSKIVIRWYEAKLGTVTESENKKVTNKETTNTESTSSKYQTMCLSVYNPIYADYYTICYYYNGQRMSKSSRESFMAIKADTGTTVTVSFTLWDKVKVSTIGTEGAWSCNNDRTFWRVAMNGYNALTVKLYK